MGIKPGFLVENGKVASRAGIRGAILRTCALAGLRYPKRRMLVVHLIPILEYSGITLEDHELSSITTD
jgi:hypothetical protein